MILHYLKVAVRSLMKYKMQTAISLSVWLLVLYAWPFP